MLKPFWTFGSITRGAAVGNCKVLCHKTSFRQTAFFSIKGINIWNPLCTQHKIDHNWHHFKYKMEHFLKSNQPWGNHGWPQLCHSLLHLSFFLYEFLSFSHSTALCTFIYVFLKANQHCNHWIYNTNVLYWIHYCRFYYLLNIHFNKKIYVQ